MANTNTLANVVPQILAQGLLALRENTVMPRLVNGDYSEEAKEKGDTIDVPVSVAIAANAVTPSYVPPDDTGVTPGKVQIVLDQWYEAPFFMSDQDMAKSMKGILPMQASEAIKALANNVDDYILALYKSFYGYVGTAGTTPFASDTTDATAARKVLFDQLCPPGDRRAVLDTDAEANALNLRAFQDVSWRGDKEGIIEGQIGRKLGFDWFMDQNTPTHTTGAAGTVLVDETGAIAVGTKTFGVDGLTTKPSAGDIFTIAGDTQTYTVISATDLAGTDSTLVFEPGLKVALPDADTNEAITFKASHVANLAFHREAIAFATRPLEVPEDGLGSVIAAATDPVSGLTLRLEVSRQHRRNRWAWDILYGAKVVRAELGCRIAG